MAGVTPQGAVRNRDHGSCSVTFLTTLQHCLRKTASAAAAHGVILTRSFKIYSVPIKDFMMVFGNSCGVWGMTAQL